MFAIANSTTRRPDQNTPKQQTHGALVVVLAVQSSSHTSQCFRKLAHIILNILTHKPYLNRDIIEIIVQISITESTAYIIEDTNPTLPDCKPTRPNQETPKHYIIEIKVFAIANTTRRPDQNTPKQEILAVRGDAAHN